MSKKTIFFTIFCLSATLFIGCESQSIIKSAKADTQNIEYIPKNKIGEVLKLEKTIEYTKVFIRTKIYEESIFYEIDLKYSPKILEVPDENNLNQKIKKDLSQVTFEEWISKISDASKNHKVTILYKDEDNFTILKKEIYLKDENLDFSKGIFFEGNMKIDKSLSSKIQEIDINENFHGFKSP